jgi:1-acyl-sn-glycerol-3-phosphate acyltransferase
VRRELLKKVFWFTSLLVLTIVGITVEKTIITADEIDYSHYLGPDYKKDKSSLNEGGRASKIISPHVSCFDVQTMGLAFGGDISFVAGAFVKDLPGLGAIAKYLGCVFVPRGGSKDQLGESLESMTKRTAKIE